MTKQTNSVYAIMRSTEVWKAETTSNCWNLFKAATVAFFSSSCNHLVWAVGAVASANEEGYLQTRHSVTISG